MALTIWSPFVQIVWGLKYKMLLKSYYITWSLIKFMLIFHKSTTLMFQLAKKSFNIVETFLFVFSDYWTLLYSIWESSTSPSILSSKSIIQEANTVSVWTWDVMAAGQLPGFLRSVLSCNWVAAVCFRWWWAVQSLPGCKHWIRGRHRAAQQFLPSQPRWESIYTVWYKKVKKF